MQPFYNRVGDNVVYYGETIMTFSPDGSFTLIEGDCKTAHAKMVMYKFLPEGYHLGHSRYLPDPGVWVLTTPYGDYLYEKGMHVPINRAPKTTPMILLYMKSIGIECESMKEIRDCVAGLDKKTLMKMWRFRSDSLKPVVMMYAPRPALLWLGKIPESLKGMYHQRLKGER